jgi:hypothetical protein
MHCGVCECEKVHMYMWQGKTRIYLCKSRMYTAMF